MKISKQICRLAFPSILGYFGLTLFELTDIFWIGKLGPKAVAAIAASSFIEWIIYAFMCFTTTGCATFVSQFHGAQKKKEIHQVVKEAFHLSLIISFIVAILLFMTISPLFTLMGLDNTTHDYAMKYFRVIVFGFPLLYIFNLQGQIFNAHGDTKTATWVMLVAIALNIILDPFFIFGWWGVPKLGIAGASIASLISTFIAILIRSYLLRKKGYAAPIKSLFSFTQNYMLGLVKIGAPTAINNAVWSFSFPLLAVIITKFGMEPLAGLNIANRIEGIPYFMSVGFGVAVSTIVGQSIGRGEKQDVHRILVRGIGIISILLFPVCLVFILIPEQLISLLSNDPLVIKYGASYLRIIGYFEIFLGWEMVIEGAFNGLGNTRPYMLIRVPLTLARFPLAYLFAISFGFGIEGVWWAISLTTFAKAIALFIAFKVNKTNRRLLEGAN